MQNLLNSQAIDSKATAQLENVDGQKMSPKKEANLKIDGEYVARVFKFYRMKQNPYVVHGFSLKSVPFKTIYRKHKNQFDRFAEMAVKNNFDIDSYMKYCVKCGINENCIDSCLSSTTMLVKYIDYVKNAKRLKKIYKDFLKSTKNI